MKKILFVLLSLVMTVIVCNSQCLIKPNQDTKTLISSFVQTTVNTIFLNCDTINNYYLAVETKLRTHDDYLNI